MWTCGECGTEFPIGKQCPKCPQRDTKLVDRDGRAVLLPIGGLLENSSISRRDFFAAMAMHGMLLNPECDMWDLIKGAVLEADMLIAELDKK